MKANHWKLPQVIIWLLGGIAAISFWSCGGTPIEPRPTETYTYRFEGAFVKNLGTDFATVRVVLTREDTIFSRAEIRFGVDSLAFQPDSAYWRVVKPAGAYPTGTYNIVIRDSSLFHDTLQTSLPADFVIDNVFPDTRIKLTGIEAKLEWTASSGSEGYVIAAVKREQAYTGAGFSQYVTEQATASIFPDSAFNKPYINEPDTGWYYLYVYSYTGSPDSALTAELLPVPMPNQLSDNITATDITGRFGSIVVTAFDSMYVAVMP
jgi:hypothetical protein